MAGWMDGWRLVMKPIWYFEKPGPGNTDRCIELARKRAEDLGLGHVVVATSSGATALKVRDAFKGLKVKIVAVTLHAGRWLDYGPPDLTRLEELKKSGVQVLTSTHALMGSVDTAIRKSFGGLPPTELIARTLYLFGQGMKVACEITLMAADAGLIPLFEEVIAIAGTDVGADTAVVLKSSSTDRIFDLEVREIVCMPRSKRA